LKKLKFYSIPAFVTEDKEDKDKKKESKDDLSMACWKPVDEVRLL
jgi:hypothetical protein